MGEFPSLTQVVVVVRFLLLFSTILFPFPNSCLSTTAPLILSLKTKQLSPLDQAITPRPPNKLSFHHNVSLTVSLTVGSPPQQATMVLDTGSELSWLHCKTTTTATHTFDSRLSTSYRSIPCSDPTCTAKTRDFPLPVSCDKNNLCHVILSYADSSSAEGTLASDTFRIAGSGSTTVFGCMDSGTSSTPDEDAKTMGLIGMNRGALSFVSQMGFPQFSYCISSRDSSGVLIFGEANLPWLGPLNYTPLISMTTPLPYFDRIAYTIQLQGIKVSNAILPLPKSIFEPDHTGAGQTMVDSGTQFTFLLGPAYTALKNEFLKQTRGILQPLGEPNFVFQGAMDICFKIEISRGALPALPSVSLVFGGAEMKVSGEQLMYRVPGEARGPNAVYCMTFGNSDMLGVEAYVIGHHQQQNLWMEFDLVKSRVGLAEVRCDIASQRLGLG